MMVKSASSDKTSEYQNSKSSTDDVFLFPTTIAQQGFWYLDQVDPGNPAYNIAVRFRLLGSLDRVAFDRAVQTMVQRHEVLRTRIVKINGEPFQVVSPSLMLDIGMNDLTGLPREDRFPCSESLAITEAAKRFDMEVGPLIRVTLLRLDEQEHVLLITIHHVISDGWSIGLMASEIGLFYEAFREGHEPRILPLALQYGDFAVWQKQWLQSEDFESHRTYWHKKLVGLPLLEIPTDRPRPRFQTSNGYIESILLSKALTDELNRISHSAGTTLFTLAIAALKVMLKRETKETNIYVGTLISGRSRIEVEPLIGPFINPVVLQTWIRDDPTFLDLLGRVSTTVLDGIQHGELPFERLVETIQPKRDLSRHPVFQINFIFQRDFVKPFQAAGLALTAIPSKSPGAIYDLNFFMVERADGWRASCEYNTDLYDASTVNRLLSHFKAVLEGIAHDPNQRISKLPSVVHPASSLSQTVPDPGNRKSTDIASEDSRPGKIERQLKEIWERLIGVDSIGIDDDFFDVGGHSLLAMKLLGEIERDLGQRMTLATFLHEPTIRALTDRLLEVRLRSRRDQAIPLQTDGKKAPLVLVDTGPYYRPLIRRLGHDQPIIGLALPELSELPRHFTVEHIAANLIEALRDVQPRGPYYLSGWCHAGTIAFEMARQLRSEGADVPLVMLFDSDNPRYVRSFRTFKSLPIRLYFVSQKFAYHVGRLRSRHAREIRQFVHWQMVSMLHQFRQKISRILYRNSKSYTTESIKRSSEFLFLAMSEYDPRPLDAALVLFRSEDLQTGRFRDPEMGWGDVARAGLEVHSMPGNHSAMLLEPGVEDLARRVSDLIPLAGKL